MKDQRPARSGRGAAFVRARAIQAGRGRVVEARQARRVLALLAGGVVAASAAGQEPPRAQERPRSALEERFVDRSASGTPTYGPALASTGDEARAPGPDLAEPGDASLEDLAYPGSQGTGQELEIATIRAEESRAWTWRIAPYVWAADLEGDVSLGPATVEFDFALEDIVDHLEVSADLLVEARSERFALIADTTYLELELEGEGPGGIDVDADTKAAILGLVALYRILPDSHYEVGAGARYLDVELDLDPGGISADSDSLDGVVAARATWPFGTRWSLSLYGDVGAGDADLTWQASALLHYGLEIWGFGLGYRVLDYDLEDDGNELDAALHGFLIGLDFRF